AELGGQVALQHAALGALPVRELRPSPAGEGFRGLAPPLRLPRQHPAYLVVGQLAGHPTGNLLGGGGGERHPQRRSSQLVPTLDRGGQVGLQAGLELGHVSGNYPGAMRSSCRLPLAAVSVTAATLAYATLVERNRFVLRRFEVPVLAPESAPLRVLHLSDLHLTSGQRRKTAWV